MLKNQKTSLEPFHFIPCFPPQGDVLKGLQVAAVSVPRPSQLIPQSPPIQLLPSDLHLYSSAQGQW